MSADLIQGDCLTEMRRLAEEDVVVQSVVTDPPYGLNFMGKEWDRGVPGVPFWAAARDLLPPGGHLVAFGGTRTFHRMAVAIEYAGFELRDTLMWLYGTGFPKSRNQKGEWDGWGTALKPAWEPIILARKPLVGTVAANVLAHGTGAINVAACQIAVSGSHLMRAPANVLHDGSPEVEAAFAAFGLKKSGKPGIMRKGRNDGACLGAESRPPGTPMTGFGDSGSASRFFYSSKASAADRAGSKHPTVKPVALMRWLVRLITPPGGTVLDPFAGSGTTGAAAVAEGMRCILIESEDEYVADIRHRLHALAPQEKKMVEAQMSLFGDGA